MSSRKRTLLKVIILGDAGYMLYIITVWGKHHCSTNMSKRHLVYNTKAQLEQTFFRRKPIWMEM